MGKFDYLNLPETWQTYFTKYPEGYTMLEALINWVSQVNTMTDNVNDWNVYLDDFVAKFDTNLQSTVGALITAMKDDGTLNQIINQQVFGDLSTKANNPLAQIADSSIPSSKLKTANNSDKIQLANLSSEVIQALAGTAPVGSIPGNQSVTSQVLANGAVLEQHMGFRFKQGAILDGTLLIDTAAKTVSITASLPVGYNGGYYTAAVQSIVFTGLTTRVNFVFFNPDTLQFEVYETGTVPANQKLLLICSFYKGEIGFSTTPKRIFLDGQIAGNVQEKFKHGSVISGSITIDTTALTVTATGALVSRNGKYITVPNKTVTYTNPNNRVQYVYIKESNGDLVVYENSLAPTNPDLILMCAFWNGKIYNTMSFSGITLNGAGVLDSYVAPLVNTRGNGKKANFLGDSITYGQGGTIPYPNVIKSQLGLASSTNYGVSGTAIAIRSGRTDSFIERYSTMAAADIIGVMGGTNDFWTNVPLGTLGSTDNSTFYGALENLVTGLINKFPNAFIYFATPPKGYRNPDGSNGATYPNEGANTAGNTMEQFNQAVKDVCGKHSIPVLDVKHMLGIDPAIPVHFSTFTSDGIHFNDNGYSKMGKLHANFIQTYINI